MYKWRIPDEFREAPCRLEVQSEAVRPWHIRCFAVAHTPNERERILAKIAMPLDSDFEDSEYRVPYDALVKAGHEVVILGLEKGKEITGKQGKETAAVDSTASEVRPEDFDALVIPGGYSPDHLRTSEKLVDFVRKFEKLKRPIAAVCHGPQLLIEADVVRDRTLTSWPSVKTDLKNAGAKWVDQEVCEDGTFITSRKPGDLQAFSAKILERLAA